MRKIFSLFIITLCGLTSLAQNNGTFKAVRFVNVLDSTTVLPINGSIYYNEQSDKFRVYQDNVWYDLLGGGGGGDSIPYLPRYVSTTYYGAVTDADVSLGSSTFGTDQYAILQEILDLALDNPDSTLVVVWDGKYSISQTLQIHSNTRIIGTPGSGVIMRNNVAGNPTCFTNANEVFSSSTGGYGSNIINQNISVEGMIINGNNLNQVNRFPAMTIIGGRNILINSCQFLAAETFGFYSTNTQSLTVQNCYVNPGASAPEDNHDGIHIDGYALNTIIQDIRLDNIDDDGVVFMAESNGGLSRGPITNGIIDGVQVSSGSHGIRLSVGSTGFDLNNITVSNVTLNTSNDAILLAFWTGDTGSANNVTIQNASIILNNQGTAFRFEGGIYRNVVIDGVTVTDNTSNSYLLSTQTTSSSQVGRLSISNVWYRATVAKTVSPLSVLGTGSIGVAKLTNINFDATSFSNVPAISIQEECYYLYLDNIFTTQFQGTCRITSAGIVTALEGKNITALNESYIFDVDINLTRSFFSNLYPITSGVVFDNTGIGNLGQWNGQSGNTLTPAQITADQNNYAPTGIRFSAVVRASTDASRTLTGLSASQAGQRGIVFMNVGSNNLLFAAEDANSTAANRFAAAYTLLPGYVVELIYDPTASRWRITGSDASVSLTSTEIAFGSGTNTVTSEAALSYNSVGNAITLVNSSSTSSTLIGGDFIRITNTGSGLYTQFDQGQFSMGGITGSDMELNPTTGDNIILNINGAGSVGVGSNAPTAQLQVTGTTNNRELFRVEESVGGNIALQIRESAGVVIISMPTLPTSCTGLSTGDIANVSGTLTVCP